MSGHRATAVPILTRPPPKSRRVGSRTEASPEGDPLERLLYRLTRRASRMAAYRRSLKHARSFRPRHVRTNLRRDRIRAVPCRGLPDATWRAWNLGRYLQTPVP